MTRIAQHTFVALAAMLITAAIFSEAVSVTIVQPHTAFAGSALV